MTSVVTLQLQDDFCAISMPADAWLKVKVYSSAGCPVLTAEHPTCLLPLPVDGTFHLDAYDGDGESPLLRADYVRTASGLVQEKKTLDRGEVVIS